jgi:hypothetical protein
MPDTKKYLSKIVKGSDTLWLKDAEARESIEDIYSKISGGLHYLGKSTTPIADGDAQGPWVIDGVTYVVSNPSEGQKVLAAGDIAIYGESEFIWSGASGKWQEFGSTGSLGALAFKDSASGTYTPAGTNAASTVSFTGTADGDFVTGYNNDGVAPSFVEGTFSAGSLPTFQEGAFTAASLGTGFYTPGTAPSFSEGAFSAGSLPSKEADTFDAGSLPSKAADTFTQGTLPSLGAETKSAFATEGEVSTYDEDNETLTLSAASTSDAVTAQGTFAAGSLPTFTEGAFSAGSLPSYTEGAFDAGSLPSKAADTWNAGSMAAIDVTKFDGGSKAADSFTAGTLPSKDADTFNAGSAATLATSKAITDLGTAEAAAQTFTGTQATITVE